ncbi:MAG: hypothetical protein HQL32_09135, partial [Planctomycetes bacterium]|nr:hypothetical protein [Planctomycetota bacterium]
MKHRYYLCMHKCPMLINKAFCATIMILSWNQVLHSAYISTTGNINFIHDNSPTSAMNINSTGLGVGVSPSANLHIEGTAVVSGNIHIGTGTSSSTFTLNGNMSMSIESVNADTTLGANSLVFVDTSSSNITLTLPYAANVTGRNYIIRKTSEFNTLTISGDSNLIDNNSKQYLAPCSTPTSGVSLLSQGGQWHTLWEQRMGWTPSVDPLLTAWFDFS